MKSEQNKAFDRLCRKYRINSDQITKVAEDTFNFDKMTIQEKEVALARTLAISCGVEFAQVIGDYFDAIHREEQSSTVEKITEQMFKDCFTLKVQSPDLPEFNQWSGQITIKDRYILSIQAGRYMMSSPKRMCPSPDDYSEYEMALIDTKTDSFVKYNTFVEGVSEYEQVLGYKSVSEILEITNNFIERLNNGEVKNA